MAFDRIDPALARGQILQAHTARSENRIEGRSARTKKAREKTMCLMLFV